MRFGSRSVAAGGMRGPNASPGVFDFPRSLIGAGAEALYRLDPGQFSGAVLGDLDTITDQTGNGRTATGATSHKPILDPAGNSFASASAFFTGDSWMDIAAGLAAAMNATAWSVWAVTAQADDVSVSQSIFSIGNAAGYSMDLESSKWSVRSYGVGVMSDGTVPASAAPHLVLATRDSGTVHIYVDGVEQSVSTPTIGVSAPSGTSQLGQLVTGLFPLVGWILEAVAVSRVLTADERAALAAYAPAWHRY